MMKKAPPWTSSLAATKPWLWWVACTFLGGQPLTNCVELELEYKLVDFFLQTVLSWSSLTNWLMTNIRGWPLLSTLALTLACWPGRHSLCRRKSLRDRLPAHFATRTSPIFCFSSWENSWESQNQAMFFDHHDNWRRQGTYIIHSTLF